MRKLDDLLLAKFKKDGTLQYYDNFLSAYPSYNLKPPALSAFVDFFKSELKLFRKARYPGVAELGWDEAFFKFINSRHPVQWPK